MAKTDTSLTSEARRDMRLRGLQSGEFSFSICNFFRNSGGRRMSIGRDMRLLTSCKNKSDSLKLYVLISKCFEGLILAQKPFMQQHHHTICGWHNSHWFNRQQWGDCIQGGTAKPVSLVLHQQSHPQHTGRSNKRTDLTSISRLDISWSEYPLGLLLVSTHLSCYL